MKHALKLLKWVMLGLACLFIMFQFIRPARTNPLIDPAQTIEARTRLAPEVEAIFVRSCNDCHSNKTVWPWYIRPAGSGA